MRDGEAKSFREAVKRSLDKGLARMCADIPFGNGEFAERTVGRVRCGTAPKGRSREARDWDAIASVPFST